MRSSLKCDIAGYFKAYAINMFFRPQGAFSNAAIRPSVRLSVWLSVSLTHALSSKTVHFRAVVNIHCESKKTTLNSCSYLPQMLTDFQNSFADRLIGKFVINIPPHLKYVAKLPCEI